jgi:type I site-specific restriction-modification system R (restriction) subunit
MEEPVRTKLTTLMLALSILLSACGTSASGGATTAVEGYITALAAKDQAALISNSCADYKDTIPHLFWYNGLLLLSNGSASRLGSITSKWERFSEWKKINAEGEEGVISLETMLRGVCEPSRLLDMVENFILFQKGNGGLQKIVAKNHQFLGANNSFEAAQNIRENAGKSSAKKLMA